MALKILCIQLKASRTQTVTIFGTFLNQFSSFCCSKDDSLLESTDKQTFLQLFHGSKLTYDIESKIVEKNDGEKLKAR